MAFELHRYPGFPAVGASALNVNQPVGFVTGDTQRRVVPLATSNVEPLGVAQASVVNPGDAVTIYDLGHVCRVPAAASLGAGVDVGVASSNGAFGPLTAASGVAAWSLGKSMTAAAAGETFSLYIRPRQLGGLA